MVQRLTVRLAWTSNEMPYSTASRKLLNPSPLCPAALPQSHIVDPRLGRERSVDAPCSHTFGARPCHARKLGGRKFGLRCRGQFRLLCFRSVLL